MRGGAELACHTERWGVGASRFDRPIPCLPVQISRSVTRASTSDGRFARLDHAAPGGRGRAGGPIYWGGRHASQAGEKKKRSAQSLCKQAYLAMKLVLPFELF